MSREADDSQDDPIGDETETTKRSERKRQREKQRRSDLSNAFDELAAFIVQVEPDAAEAEDPKKKRKKAEGGDESSSGITRLDLIGRALRIMKRLHRENDEYKRVIASMNESGHNHDNVMVMVPQLTPVPDDSFPVARASYPPSYPPGYYQGSSAPHQHPPPPPDYPMNHHPGPPPTHSQYPPNWNGYSRGMQHHHHHHPRNPNHPDMPPGPPGR